jgi:hypothetical protein
VADRKDVDNDEKRQEQRRSLGHRDGQGDQGRCQQTGPAAKACFGDAHKDQGGDGGNPELRRIGRQ